MTTIVTRTKVTFINLPEEREQVAGTYDEGVVLTYSDLRVPLPDGSDWVAIADLSAADGMWHYGGRTWTDVNIDTVVEVIE